MWRRPKIVTRLRTRRILVSTACAIRAKAGMGDIVRRIRYSYCVSSGYAGYAIDDYIRAVICLCDYWCKEVRVQIRVVVSLHRSTRTGILNTGICT
eukprot:scaffold377538_cov15-Prasinocladus_malaysianus.AAC.1